MDVTAKAPTWRTSSYTHGNGGACVEVGNADRAIVVRDTKDRAGQALIFPTASWRAFATALKTR